MALLLVHSGGCRPESVPSLPEDLLNKEQAIEILLDEVIQPDELDHYLIAFTLDEPLPEDTEVAPYAPSPLPLGIDSLPYLVPEKMRIPTWFFWVDDSPFARFSHSTRFVFIDALSGSVTVSEHGWWPYINGDYVARWTDDDKRWDSHNWAFSNIPSAAIPDKASTITTGRIKPLLYQTLSLSLVDALGRSLQGPPALPEGEAMIALNGWHRGQSGKIDMDVDIRYARDFAVETANIPLYEPVGRTKDDIELAIQAAVDDGADDIFFYFTGHAKYDSSGAYLDYKRTIIYSTELADIFKKFCNTRFKVVLDCCHSGGFADALMNSCKVDIFMASCEANEDSHDDIDTYREGEQRDPNSSDIGGEYSSSLWEALDDINNSPELQERAREIADEKNISEFAGWLAIADGLMLETNFSYLIGVTHPFTLIRNAPCPPCQEQTVIQKQPPYILFSFPAPGTDNASGETQIKIGFSEPMDEDSMAEAMHMSANGTEYKVTEYTVTFEDNDQKVVITPVEIWRPGAVHTVTIATGARSKKGVPLAENYTFSFTTEEKTVEPVSIIGTHPPQDGLVGLEGRIKIVFSAPMNEEETTQALTISPPAKYTIFWENNSQEMIVSPVGTWQPGTLYSVTITDEAMPKKGSYLEKDYTFSFKTEETAAEPVSVIGTYPAQGGIVSPEDQVKIGFSAPMDEDATEQALIVFPPAKYMVYWENNNREMIISPLEPWQSATLYTVTVSNEAKSQEGLNLKEDHTFSFTTEEEPAEPVTVIGTYPAQGGIVSPEGQIMIVFSESMKEAEVLATLDINPATAEYEAFLQDNNEVLVIYPVGMWPMGITIEISIDIEGEILSEPFTLTFSVE